MPTRNVNLTDRYDALLSRLVESGRYKNASEVVRAGLRLLERQDQAEEAKLEALRREVSLGTEAFERGEYTVLEDDATLDRFFEDITSDGDADRP